MAIEVVFQHLPMSSADSLDIHTTILLYTSPPTLEGGQEVYISIHQHYFAWEMRADYRTATTPGPGCQAQDQNTAVLSASQRRGRTYQSTAPV